MRIVKPYYEIELMDGQEMLRKLEKAGRTCYKSEDNMTFKSEEKFIRGIIKSGHESILEHEKVSVRIICNRGITHEIVRHRIGAYSQESSRYCSYSGEVTFILPLWVDDMYLGIWSEWPGDQPSRNNEQHLAFKAEKIWFNCCLNDEKNYKQLLECGWKPEHARGILPNDLKTEIVCTYNLRTWRHIFKLRALGITGRPHPQMLELMVPMLEDFKQLIPVVFEDLIIK